MSVAVYNHYKRLYNNLPPLNPNPKPQPNPTEPLNALITNLSSQQQRKFDKSRRREWIDDRYSSRFYNECRYSILYCTAR